MSSKKDIIVSCANAQTLRDSLISESLITKGLGFKTLITKGLGGIFSDDEIVVDEPVIAATRSKNRKGRSKHKDAQLRQYLHIFASMNDEKKTNYKEFIPHNIPRVYASLQENKKQQQTLKEAINPYKFNGNTVTFNENEWKFLTFAVKIESSIKQDASYELIIHENDDIGHTFRGVPTKDGVVIRIPPLVTILEAQQYIASFRVIVGEHMFVPLLIKIDLIESDSIKEALNRANLSGGLMNVCAIL